MSKLPILPLLLLLMAALPPAARADVPIANKTISDATGGATATVELMRRSSDGAVYPRVWVRDTKADGVCAHAAVLWHHDNGNTYTDYGSWVCGAGKSDGPKLKPARNWRAYRSVSLAAFVDGATPSSTTLYTFKTETARDPEHPEGVTMRKCGPKTELRALISTAAAGGGQPGNNKVGSARDQGVQRVGLVQNCIVKTDTHMFARTWIDLDDGWELAQRPMLIVTELVDERAAKRVGARGKLGVKVTEKGKLTKTPWFVTRRRGDKHRAEYHHRWNKPGSVYVYETGPVKRTKDTRERFYTTRSKFDFVASAFKNTSHAPLAVYWANYGEALCAEGDCGFYVNEMTWGGGYTTG